MKLNLTTKIFLGTIACFGLASVFARMAGNNGISQYWTDVAANVTPKASQRLIEMRLPAENMNELQVDGTYCDIKIETSPDEELHLKYSAKSDGNINENDFLKDIGNGVYKLDLDKTLVSDRDVKISFVNVFNFNLMVEDAHVTLQIPKNVKKIKVKSVSGDITATINADEFDSDAVSGDLKLKGEFANVKAKSVSGNVKMISQSETPNAQLKTVSGDVKLIFQNDPDVNLSFETTSGEIGFDHKLTKTKFEGSVKELKLGSGKGRVLISTVSGDARVTRQSEIE